MAQYYKNTTNINDATIIELGSEENLRDIDVSLLPVNRLGGTVINENGDPIPNVLVQPWLQDPTTKSWNTLEGVYSDGNGNYRVSNPANGIYRFRFITFGESENYAYEYYDDVDDFDLSTNVIVTPSSYLTNVNAFA